MCQGCRRLARGREAFDDKGKNRYRHECSKNKWSSAVPVRFVAACKRGHLSDFPWAAFAHLDREGHTCDRPELYLDENALGDIGRIIVRCENCGARQPMSRATVLPSTCSGDRPWLGGRAASEPCHLQSELLVRTASHAHFAQVVSALRLPDPEPDPLRLRLREKDVWRVVQNVTNAQELEMMARLVESVGSAIRGFSTEAVLEAIRAEKETTGATAERPLRSAEYERLVTAPLEPPGVVVDRGVQFAAFRVPTHKVDLPAGIRGLVVVPELREIRVPGELQPFRLRRTEPSRRVRFRRQEDQTGGAHDAHGEREVAPGRRGTR